MVSKYVQMSDNVFRNASVKTVRMPQRAQNIERICTKHGLVMLKFHALQLVLRVLARFGDNR
jgi:hypothetical protein